MPHIARDDTPGPNNSSHSNLHNLPHPALALILVLHHLLLHPSVGLPVPLLLLNKFNTVLKARLVDKIITLTTIEVGAIIHAA